jgi:hypothetical protein
MPSAVAVPSVIRRGSTSRIFVTINGCDGNAQDATALTLTVLDECDRAVFHEDFFQALIAPFFHRIIKTPSEVGSYYIDWGDAYFQAIIMASGGTYPTGFVGGETLQLNIDGLINRIAFQSGDQTLDQVVARINGVYGPLLGQAVAFNVNGQLVLKSKGRGDHGQLWVNAFGTTPSVLTALGLTVQGPIYGYHRGPESANSGTILFVWKASTADSGSEETEAVQSIHIIPSAVYQMLPQLRILIDKTNKLVDVSKGCFLGYTDTMLLQYLIGGLQTINTYQPYPQFSFDNFPYAQFGSILVESAFLWGVMSQTLYAIDNDVPSYSDQGTAFVINHQTALAQHLNWLSQKLDKAVPQFKLHFVSSGVSLVQQGPSYRLNALLSAAPSGSLFRNTFLAGG